MPRHDDAGDEDDSDDNDEDVSFNGGSSTIGPWGPMLRSKLYKKHQKPRFGNLGNIGKRYYEVDDQLGGVLYCFKDYSCLQKRMPHSVHALGDESVTAAAPTGNNGRMGGRLSKKPQKYITAYSFEITLPGEPRPLLLGSRNAEVRTQWVDGIVRRAKVATSRLVQLEGCGSKGDHPSTLLRVGVRVQNLSWSPIGVQISYVEPGSSAATAGLRVGDAIVAVQGTACLSHAHAGQMLLQAGGPVIEVIVSSAPAEAPWPSAPAEGGPVDLS